MPAEEITFEQAVAGLEEIVAALETGSLPLDEALRQFERAVGLSRYCAEKLDRAEAQIAVLGGEGGPIPAPESDWVSPAPPE